MPTFVALGKYTDRGITNLEAFRQRHQEAVKRAEARGAKILGSYALMGPWDFMVVLECHDAATCMRVLTKEASGGNVRCETFAAVPMEEFAEKVAEAA
ncbi:MAG: GYD domain-containing protein [Chloroflexi bacterium]|nr:GYD domain-containing protein [Chloroflexota bacterium]